MFQCRSETDLTRHCAILPLLVCRFGPKTQLFAQQENMPTHSNGQMKKDICQYTRNYFALTFRSKDPTQTWKGSVMYVSASRRTSGGQVALQ